MRIACITWTVLLSVFISANALAQTSNATVGGTVADSTGALALEQVVSTDGDWPRNFSLDPTGRWLLVANQRSDSIVVFECDQTELAVERAVAWSVIVVIDETPAV